MKREDLDIAWISPEGFRDVGQVPYMPWSGSFICHVALERWEPFDSEDILFQQAGATSHTANIMMDLLKLANPGR